MRLRGDPLLWDAALALLTRALLLLAAAAAAAASEGEAACPAGAASCGGAGAYYWPAQKGTPGRTGFSPHAVPGIAGPPAWSWADPHNDVIRATPLFDARRNVYLTTIAGRVYKFGPDGRALWQQQMPFAIPTVGCLYEGRLIASTKAGDVFALDMETGSQLWRAPVSIVNTTSGDTASMFCYNGTVVSATHNQVGNTEGGNADVVAVRAEDGGLLWRYSPEIGVYNFQASNPEDGTIVFQDRAGGLYRLRLGDGSEVWRSGKRGVPWTLTFTTGATVCHEGKVFVVSNAQAGLPWDPVSGLLHAYALEDGRLLWEQYLPYSANQAAAVGPAPGGRGGSIAVVGIGTNPSLPLGLSTSQNAGLLVGGLCHLADVFMPWLFARTPAAMQAYDAETGARLWHYELPPYRKMATRGDTERLLRRYEDMSLGRNPNNDPVCLPDSCSQPVIGPDGTAYQGWQDGRLYAIKDANGDGRIDESEVSWHQLSDGFQGSLGLAPGMLAAAPCGGGLYVWKS